ncbi:PIG-L family deacetylase [Candidatus Micrarchaeota archaeon]|nr:PIG-L family deacetylase [Candidatus Micrarchaeota archaeon]
MKVLVVAAHPDDEVLGAGATIAKHTEKGDDVKVLILGTGVTSREVENPRLKVEELVNDSKRALSLLDVSDIIHLDFPDNQFDSVSLLDIIKEVEKIVSKFNPETVYTHHWGDLNVDHRLTFDAVLTACRPFSSNVRKILCFEVLSSTECTIQSVQNSFAPNYFVECKKTIKKKIDALKEYKSEIKKCPHPRSLESVEYLSRYRGTMIGREYAEAFVLVRDIKGD